MTIDTYKDGRKILDLTEIVSLEKSEEPISVKTSTKIRKILRYCDRYSDGKAISIYRGHQPYDDTELRTVKGWRKIYRKPKSEFYVFSMRANRKGGEWFDYCFIEDTIELSEKEKERIRTERRERRKFLKERREWVAEQIKREEGVWKTAWQWLSEDQKKVENDSYPRRTRNLFYNKNTASFEEAKKPFYYYSEYDTVEISEEEYQELKRQYIAKFGGWEKIDLEHTDYDGKKWY